MRRSPHSILLVAASIWLVGAAADARAELPALQKVLTAPIKQVAMNLGIDDSVLVAVRDTSKRDFDWRVSAAVGAELQEALLRTNVAATDAATEADFAEVLAKKYSFRHTELSQFSKGRWTHALLGEIARVRDHFELRIKLYALADSRSLASSTVRLEEKTLTVSANTPALNAQVARTAAAAVGRKYRDGKDWSFVTGVLEDAGAKRKQDGQFGRNLWSHEPLLPGDVLLFKDAEFTAPNGKVVASIEQHAAIIEQIEAPDRIVVLHQNYGQAAEVVTRLTLQLDQLTSGEVVAFRPGVGPAILPDAPTKRPDFEPPVDSSGGFVNLIELIDPEQHAVAGGWTKHDQTLVATAVPYSRLQIPIEPPRRYTLRMKYKRVQNVDSLGLGLVVGGRQALLLIDAYQGKFTGFHTLDGKKSDSNESTVLRPNSIPRNQEVGLVCRVTEDSVTLSIDGVQTFAWTGDPARLAVESRFIVPHSEWLFLSPQNDLCTFSDLTLESNQ